MTVIALQSFDETLASGEVVAVFPAADRVVRRQFGRAVGDADHHVAHRAAISRLRDWWRVLRRELVMGLTLGAWLGGIAYLGALLVVDGPTPLQTSWWCP